MMDESKNNSEPVQVLERQPGDEEQAIVQAREHATFQRSWSFWAVYVALILLALMSSIDATIITTSLPTITKDIGGGDKYVWVANGFLFASTATQPLFAQVSNIFGRRNPILLALLLFALGSGVAGAARNVSTLIAARTIQGLGTSGLYVLADIILCDIIPLRYRGPYLSGVLSTAAVGTTVGPVIGGALAQTNWRWVFWINLPVAAVGLVILVLCLHVRSPPVHSWRHALASVDLTGNAIFIPSIVSILLGLVTGGSRYPWSSWHVLVPLIVGFLGWMTFHFYEASPRLCKQPTMPPRLFKHRTSATGFMLIFLGAIVLQAINYFLPLYFQAVKGTSPLTSGLYFLPFALVIIPSGGLGAAFISKTGHYIPLHALGFALNIVGASLFSTLNVSSTTGTWVGYQIIASAGSGLVFTATMVSTLAPLHEDDVAVANGTYSFVRSFGFVWGLTIASTAFDSQIDRYLAWIDDPAVRSLMKNGAAYAYAAQGTIARLSTTTSLQVIQVYTMALRTIWLALVAISCVGFLCVFAQKHVKLRKENTSEYGLEDVRKPRDQASDRDRDGPLTTTSSTT